MATSLTEHQVAELEATHAVGFTSQELVSAFQARGVRFSEANLRRYVQLGLVPRSRRSLWRVWACGVGSAAPGWTSEELEIRLRDVHANPP